MNYPAFYAFMGGMGFSIKLIIAVAIGRVYFHCHFIGDCIVGSIVGTGVAYFVQYINLAELVSRPLTPYHILNN
jgi:membrane-associated phospholipid phosphatase